MLRIVLPGAPPTSTAGTLRTAGAGLTTTSGTTDSAGASRSADATCTADAAGSADTARFGNGRLGSAAHHCDGLTRYESWPK